MIYTGFAPQDESVDLQVYLDSLSISFMMVMLYPITDLLQS